MFSDNLLTTIFQTALIAAQSAGQFIMENVGKAIEINYKGRANAVTEIDRRSEEIIVSQIHDAFPNHRIIAEECGEVQTNSEFRWIIDPLDGTTNFIHGYPCFSVSIAVEYQNEIIIGVVYNPVLDELFTAIQNRGAFLNRKPIHVSKISTLADSLTATGFPYETDTIFESNMEIFRAVYRKCQGVRRAGSAALDVCYVAAGRFDGFWEFGLNPWDISAGALIVQEAGGIVGDFNGVKFKPDNVSQIIATNGKIHAELLKIINQTLSVFNGE
ncbi:inositol monophosphatase [bacterium]|nr:inositol monophosphatase [bacterium]MBU1064900.1 inositol monophosphatase [bacterium]MBU1634314.1 inositol monophosphatase [bacterium]MBU1874584.1 inositol monophosphatase [bacterium]